MQSVMVLDRITGFTGLVLGGSTDELWYIQMGRAIGRREKIFSHMGVKGQKGGRRDVPGMQYVLCFTAIGLCVVLLHVFGILL